MSERKADRSIDAATRLRSSGPVGSRLSAELATHFPRLLNELSENERNEAEDDRTKAVICLLSVSQFLDNLFRAIPTVRAASDRLFRLARALSELESGRRAPILEPKKFNHRPPKSFGQLNREAPILAAFHVLTGASPIEKILRGDAISNKRALSFLNRRMPAQASLAESTLKSWSRRLSRDRSDSQRKEVDASPESDQWHPEQPPMPTSNSTNQDFIICYFLAIERAYEMVILDRARRGKVATREQIALRLLERAEQWSDNWADDGT